LRSKTPGGDFPVFSYESNKEGYFRSTAHLPSGVDGSLRIVKGHHWWTRKQSAQRDAAFQAVHDLHRQNLINDHLLPLFHDDSLVEVSQQNTVAAELPRVEDPIGFWKRVPGDWAERPIYRCRIELLENGKVRADLAMALFTPVKLPLDVSLDLFWDHETTFAATLQPLNVTTALSQLQRQVIREITTLLFHSTRGKSQQEDYPEFLPFFTPDLPLEDLEGWLDINQGSLDIQSDQSQVPLLFLEGFIRSPMLHFAPHIFVRWIQNMDARGLLIECRPFEKRRNLMQQANLSRSTSKTTCISAAKCTIDLLPWELSRASLLIPPIMQLLHQHLMAQSVQLELFGGGPEIELSSLAEAITSPSSQWPVNYQRLEFLGDSLIKFLVSTHIFHSYPRWHEGYLSKLKDLLVSNDRLTNAGLRACLGNFICADFITRKHPLFSQKDDRGAKKEVPRKVYADVVEALVAAAYENGGMSLSRKCLSKFLPEICDFTTTTRQPQKQSCQFPVHLEMKIDQLLGFKFKDRTLIWEALTHPSWQRDQTTGSYQRLEFIGDAVLDFLVARRLHAQFPKLAEGQMTELRAALVNADFLAFLCMDFVLTECDCRQKVTVGSSESTVQPENTALWMFMRHDCSDIVKIQTSCSKTYRMLSDGIKKTLKGGRSYPWATLAQLGASKFYSDILESTIGAIFIENEGGLDACERFLERIQLPDYLKRFVAQDVRLEHPKSALDRIIGTQKVDFQFNEAEDGLHNISVWLEGEEVASVNNCSSRCEALVRAADAAVVALSRV
jgi:dsRNA-specific ribonuclease